jgi:hypothetical protein
MSSLDSTIKPSPIIARLHPTFAQPLSISNQTSSSHKLYPVLPNLTKPSPQHLLSSRLPLHHHRPSAPLTPPSNHRQSSLAFTPHLSSHYQFLLSRHPAISFTQFYQTSPKHYPNISFHPAYLYTITKPWHYKYQASPTMEPQTSSITNYCNLLQFSIKAPFVVLWLPFLFMLCFFLLLPSSTTSLFISTCYFCFFFSSWSFCSFASTPPVTSTCFFSPSAPFLLLLHLILRQFLNNRIMSDKITLIIIIDVIGI